MKKYSANILKNCLRVKKNERIIIIADKTTENIAKNLGKEIRENYSDKFSIEYMEEYGERDLEGKDPISFPKKLGDKLMENDVSIYAADCLKGELESFRSPMLNYVLKNRRLRHAHLPGINEELLEIGMNVNYSKIQNFGQKLKKKLINSSKVKVKTEIGTNLEVEFNKNYAWKLCDGQITEKDWSNLPGGEVFTCAEKVNGFYVVDGIMGDFFDKKYGFLENNPVKIEIKNSRVININCKNKKLQKDINNYIKQDKNADRIGEFAIGINFGLKKLYGNMLIDEKFPGVHIAIGHGYPEKTGANWTSKAHLDCVIKKANISLDNKMIMRQGKFI